MDEPHGEEQAVVALTGRVHIDDVSVLELGLDAALVPKPLSEGEVLAQRRRDELQRDGAVK